MKEPDNTGQKGKGGRPVGTMVATKHREVTKRAGQKRLSINLPAPVFDELQDLAETSHRTMTELIRDAFALAKIAYEETSRGNKLAITDGAGRILKELVIVR